MSLCRCNRNPTEPGSGLCKACQARAKNGGKKGGAARKREQREADLRRIREHGGLVA